MQSKSLDAESSWKTSSVRLCRERVHLDEKNARSLATEREVCLGSSYLFLSHRPSSPIQPPTLRVEAKLRAPTNRLGDSKGCSDWKACLYQAFDSTLIDRASWQEEVASACMPQRHQMLLLLLISFLCRPTAMIAGFSLEAVKQCMVVYVCVCVRAWKLLRKVRGRTKDVVRRSTKLKAPLTNTSGSLLSHSIKLWLFCLTATGRTKSYWARLPSA